MGGVICFGRYCLGSWYEGEEFFLEVCFEKLRLGCFFGVRGV